MHKETVLFVGPRPGVDFLVGRFSELGFAADTVQLDQASEHSIHRLQPDVVVLALNETTGFPAPSVVEALRGVDVVVYAADTPDGRRQLDVVDRVHWVDPSRCGAVDTLMRVIQDPMLSSATRPTVELPRQG